VTLVEKGEGEKEKKISQKKVILINPEKKN
jgi:hypothetical protein